jgi:MoaA/NifB/PqqE/SkfB family radical SAM enzyme
MSGPNAAYPYELSPKESMNLCKKIADFGIPYAALSGGEPLLYPGFWDLFLGLGITVLKLRLRVMVI